MSDHEDPAGRQDYEPVGELVRIYQRGGRWYANFQHEGRQHRQSLHTGSKKEARRRAIRLEAELMDGQCPAPANVPSLATVVEKYKEYLQNEGRADKTLSKYTNVFDRLLEVAKGRRVTKIAGVNLDVVDAYKARRVADEAAKKTIHTEIVVIRQLINFALSRKMITADPLEKLKLKKPKPRRQPCWSRTQMDLILAAAKDPQKAMLAVLSETGMRVGELKYLTWEDVDFEHGVIQIRAKDGWKPKTGDERAIPMSRAVRAILERLPRTGRWVFPTTGSRKGRRGGEQMSERRLLEYLKRVLKRLGLPGHVHTFRHSFISHALTQGIPEAIVREWVGHVDREVIKLYTHVLDDASQAAMRRLAQGNDPKGGQQINDQGKVADARETKDGGKTGGGQETNVELPDQGPAPGKEKMPDGTEAG